MKSTIAITTLLAMFPANWAAAAITEFNFSAPFGTEQNVEGMTFAPEPGGSPITVIPRGGLIGGTPAENANADAILTDWGLGVLNRNVPAGDDRSSLFNRIHVDGNNGAEFLRLEFSEKVQIQKVLFAFVGPFERFDLAIDGVDVDVVAELGTDEIFQLAPPGQVRGLVLLPDTLPFGTTWDFLARNSTDEWNIENIEVIPEPATLAIWAPFALGALLWGRYRRGRKGSRSRQAS